MDSPSTESSAGWSEKAALTLSAVCILFCRTPHSTAESAEVSLCALILGSFLLKLTRGASIYSQICALLAMVAIWAPAYQNGLVSTPHFLFGTAGYFGLVPILGGLEKREGKTEVGPNAQTPGAIQETNAD